MDSIDDIDMDMYMHLLEYIFPSIDDTEEACNVLAMHPELLSDEAYQMLKMILGLYNDDPNTSRKITVRQAFLADCILKGPSAALEEWKTSPAKLLSALPLEVQQQLANIHSKEDLTRMILSGDYSDDPELFGLAMKLVNTKENERSE